MSLITEEHVNRGWLWVARIEPSIGFISSGELGCLIIVLGSHLA